MSRVAPTVPAESDILCEGCGYTLTGLTDAGRCPECGKPITESKGAQRAAPAWEQPQIHRLTGFIRTTASMIFKPTQFYRTLATRSDIAPAKSFARVHWAIAALLFGSSAFIHLSVMGMLFYSSGERFETGVRIAILIALITITYLSLEGITLLASKLTNWEATYRGLRLPIPVVQRGMFYHAAHYLPVGLIALLTVGGYPLLLRWTPMNHSADPNYLYVVSAEVVISAGYLFHTYWIGMRNMMYANR